MSTTPHTRSKTHQLDNTGIWQDLAEIEQRMAKLEEIFVDIDDETTAHVQAKHRDARTTLSRGEVKQLVVIEPPENVDGSCALTKIEGIYTFLQSRSTRLERGDVVRARISDVGQNHADAIVLEKITQEVGQ